MLHTYIRFAYVYIYIYLYIEVCEMCIISGRSNSLLSLAK